MRKSSLPEHPVDPSFDNLTPIAPNCHTIHTQTERDAPCLAVPFDKCTMFPPPPHTKMRAYSCWLGNNNYRSRTNNRTPFAKLHSRNPGDKCHSLHYGLQLSPTSQPTRFSVSLSLTPIISLKLRYEMPASYQNIFLRN